MLMKLKILFLNNEIKTKNMNIIVSKFALSMDRIIGKLNIEIIAGIK